MLMNSCNEHHLLRFQFQIKVAPRRRLRLDTLPMVLVLVLGLNGKQILESSMFLLSFLLGQWFKNTFQSRWWWWWWETNGTWNGALTL